ncbi:MAG: ribosomal-processing cysteine protease Prp [Enterocloster asparagiformis]|nr:ribosomal-processing cysteine protease Prp [Enterocloster asparagiformis]
MIQVTIFRDSGESGDVFTGVELKGHAGYAESGRDIVCAAVSALVLNMANSVETFTEDGFEGEMDEQTGGFSFHFTADISPESQLLMNSLVLGLRNIEKEYGERHIIIRFEEV